MKLLLIFGMLGAALCLLHFVAATLCDSFSWKVDSLLNWRTASEVQQNLDNLEVGSVPYWTLHLRGSLTGRAQTQHHYPYGSD